MQLEIQFIQYLPVYTEILLWEKSFAKGKSHDKLSIYVSIT